MLEKVTLICTPLKSVVERKTEEMRKKLTAKRVSVERRHR
jgi:hypothetical protein